MRLQTEVWGPVRIGVLQATPPHAVAFREAGQSRAVLELSWALFEPEPGRVCRDDVDRQLMMRYPSRGLRPAQVEAALAGRLDGATPAERNGEVQRGFDFARFIAGIRDPGD